MKKTVNIGLRFAVGTYLIGGLVLNASAQTPPPASGEMRLRVTERSDGQLREIDRTYRTDGMTDARRDAIVNKLIDSLRATRKGKDSQISVTIEDDQKRTNTIRSRVRPGSRDVVGRAYTPAVPPVPPVPPIPPITAWNDNDIDVRINGLDTMFGADTLSPAQRQAYRQRMDSLRTAMRELQREMTQMGQQMQRDMAPMAREMQRSAQQMQREAERFGREMAPMADRLRRDLTPMADRFSRSFESFRNMDGWGTNGSASQSSSTVRGLEAYPSNPDRNMLNVRFNTRAKGDVLIVVTNPKGKEVATRKLNDFTGDFVGQVDLGRRAEGVYFVTVTQNEDGAVRRVILQKDASAK